MVEWGKKVRAYYINLCENEHALQTRASVLHKKPKAVGFKFLKPNRETALGLIFLHHKLSSARL